MLINGTWMKSAPGQAAFLGPPQHHAAQPQLHTVSFCPVFHTKLFATLRAPIFVRPAEVWSSGNALRLPGALGKLLRFYLRANAADLQLSKQFSATVAKAEIL